MKKNKQWPQTMLVEMMFIFWHVVALLFGLV